jgi:hypothetical protein
MYHMHSTFSVGCENPAHRHTVFAFGLFSSGEHTTPGILLLLRSFTDADVDLAMLSCTTLSLFLYLSVLSHAARITQVHPSFDPMLRIRSVDVRLIRSPATLPHAMHTQLTQVICEATASVPRDTPVRIDKKNYAVAMLIAAFTSACTSYPHRVQWKSVPDRYSRFVCPHFRQVMLVSFGSIISTGMRSSRALYAIFS